ncbi:GPO family capsid scaffolding protein [Sphingomonas oligophenolica]|uniref:Phage capsid protein n=1 Tax=Sphingomonas oligophenolica TaxID=301154 RepID=A0A502CQF4_9SPHN|nr:GPO family capsid scaffolding protein [Sphingomonas oligophenolica]TPG14349.1 phage capsid protein [Sphingomonas oligophenolica]
MAKTQFFRCFVEGATASDGRVIERDWIDQIVANFNTKTSPVRINCEHIKGFSPEPPFNGYGDIVAVRAQDDDITIDGKPVKRRALYAQAEANDQLIAVRKKGQKPYPSLELTPNFAGTGKVGMVGMAITDNPASLGVEALNFSALKPMFDGRKAAPDNFFTAAESLPIELEPIASDGTGVADAIKNGFAAVAAMFSTGEKPKEEKPKEQPKEAANDNFAAFATAIGDQMAKSIGDALKPVVDAQATLQNDFATLKSTLETTEAPGGFSRQPATGGDGAVLTDC